LFFNKPTTLPVRQARKHSQDDGFEFVIAVWSGPQKCDSQLTLFHQRKGKLAMMSRRKFSREFKLEAIRRLQGGQSAAEVARALEVHPSELYRWRRELDSHGERAFAGIGKRRAEQDQIAQLERKIGQQALEIDFLKGALQHLEEQRLLRALHTGAASTSKSTKKFKRGEG
jgi:transposase